MLPSNFPNPREFRETSTSSSRRLASPTGAEKATCSQIPWACMHDLRIPRTEAIILIVVFIGAVQIKAYHAAFSQSPTSTFRAGARGHAWPDADGSNRTRQFSSQPSSSSTAVLVLARNDEMLEDGCMLQQTSSGRRSVRLPCLDMSPFTDTNR